MDNDPIISNWGETEAQKALRAKWHVVTVYKATHSSGEAEQEAEEYWAQCRHGHCALFLWGCKGREEGPRLLAVDLQLPFKQLGIGVCVWGWASCIWTLAEANQGIPISHLSSIWCTNWAELSYIKSTVWSFLVGLLERHEKTGLWILL